MLLAIPPAVGALACYLGSHTLLLVLYLLVSLTAFAAVLPRKSQRRSDLFFMALIWSISLSLLISSSLISSNLHGQDIQDEYRISSQVIALHRWDINQNALYNSVISISLLVPILSIVSGLNALIVHQLLLPMLYSIVPLILYKIYRLIAGPRAAFLSSLLFMFYPIFYFGMVSLGRQEVAEIMLLLFLLLLMSKKGVDVTGRSVAVIFLTVGLVTAHYSLVFLFTFIVIFSTVVSLISRRSVALANPRVVLMLLVVTLAWYGFAAGGAAIFSFNSFFSKVTSGLYSDFFASTSRPTDVLLATSYAPGVAGILHDLNRFTQYFVQVLLVLGFVGLAWKSKKTLAQRQMLPVMAAAFIFLGAAVIVPFFAAGIQFNRVYHIALLFISPCLVLGMEQFDSLAVRVMSFVRRPHREVSLTSSSSKRVSLKYLALVVILISYFLFTSGWVWAVTSDRPTSLILDLQRMKDSNDPNLVVQYYNDFVPDSDIAAARWLTQYRSVAIMVCSDEPARYGVLTSYGGFARNGNTSKVRTLPGECNFGASYVYLSGFNNEQLVAYSNREGPAGGSQFPISQIWPKVIVKNRVFSDGAAIYD